MKIKKIKKLDVDIYEEVLDCGLRVYLIPQKRNNICATFNTLFGSKDIYFKPKGQDEIKDFPPGIAHFLEHKMFDLKDGMSPHKFYNKSGTYINAFTSKDKTQFIFEGPSNFKENLNYLLDFVSNPVFTDETVLKEKPIIVEEARAGLDSAGNVAFNTTMKNLFIENPYMFPIIGTFASINAITKDELMECYNTFYHPSNMVLIISGNINPEETMKIINDNFKKRDYDKASDIVRDKIVEPDNVALPIEEVHLPIKNEVFAVGYKIKINEKYDFYKIKNYLSIMTILKLGTLSEFNEAALKSGDLIGMLNIEILKVDDHVILYICGETKDTIKTFKKIKEVLLDLSIEKEDLEMLKKCHLSNMVLMNEQVTSINNFVLNNIVTYGDVLYDIHDRVNKLNIDEYNEIMQNLDFSNYTITVVKNKNS